MEVVPVERDAPPDRELTDTTPEPSSPPLKPAPWLSWAQHAAVLLALVVWARVVTTGAGGRDDGKLLWGTLSLLPATALLLPTRRALLPMLTLVGAALIVCLTAPFGFSEASVLGKAAYTGAAYAVVRSFAVTEERRLAVAAALCLVSLDQFGQAFLAWWGSADPRHPMTGTFYWHNQYAAFLLPGVMLGSALAVFSGARFRLIGFLCAPVCLAGVVYSTSRASIMLAAGGLAAVVVLAATAKDRRERWPAAAGLVALCAGVLFFFTSPVFFPDAASPLAATSARGSQETLSSNTGYRLGFWKAALGEVREHPGVGGGFGSYAELSGSHLPPAAVRSTSAHNEFLQAFAEGGLVWGLPVLGLTAAAGVAAARRLRGRLSGPGPDRPIVVGGSLSLAVLALHAAVDFDWSYPSLAVCFAVVAGLVMGIPRPDRVLVPSLAVARVPRRALLPALACLVLIVGAQVAQAHEATSRDLQRTAFLLTSAGPRTAADRLLGDRSWFPDPRIDAKILSFGANRGGATLALPEDLLSTAVARTSDLAAVADNVNAARAAVLFGLGRRQEALAAERRMARARAHSRPATLQPLARLLALDGSATEAAELLAGTIVLRAPETRGNGSLGQQLYVLYDTLAGLAPDSLALRCAGSALGEGSVALPDRAPPLAVVRDADSCTSLRGKGWA